MLHCPHRVDIEAAPQLHKYLRCRIVR